MAKAVLLEAYAGRGAGTFIQNFQAMSTDTLPTLISPYNDGSKVFLYDTNKVQIWANGAWNETTIQPVWNLGGGGS